MSDAQRIARALGGAKTGDGFLVRCPLPSHGRGRGDRTPSLSIRDGGHGLLAHCHAGCDPREILVVLRRRGLIEGNAKSPRPMTEAERKAQRERAEREDHDEAQRIARRQAIAREIFSETTDPRGTLVDKYLIDERGLPFALDDTIAQTVRFHPSCRFTDSDGRLRRAPAMVCAFRDLALTLRDTLEGRDLEEAEARILGDLGRIVGIHRTELTADGRKIGRTMLGPVKGAGVFLCSPIEIALTGALAIGEGVETCLSARRRGFDWTVALGTAGAIARLGPIPELVRIHLLAEADETSRRAIRTCGERWHAAGVGVFVAKPHAADFNELDRRAVA